MPDRPAGRAGAAGPRPEATRPKEYLEQFPIDTLTMAGTISQGDNTYGLVQTQDGLLHRVRTGNYVGQYDGRVVAVTQRRRYRLRNWCRMASVASTNDRP